MLLIFHDTNPQWDSQLRYAKQIAKRVFDSEIPSHSYEWLTPGSVKGGTPPTVALISSVGTRDMRAPWTLRVGNLRGPHVCM